MEGIILEILGDDDGVEEEELLDLLECRPELQQLLAEFIEYVQQIPEIRKLNNSQNKEPRNTARGELKILLNDITSGDYHCYQNGAHRKLEKIVGRCGDKTCVFIRRIIDERLFR